MPRHGSYYVHNARQPRFLGVVVRFFFGPFGERMLRSGLFSRRSRKRRRLCLDPEWIRALEPAEQGTEAPPRIYSPPEERTEVTSDGTELSDDDERTSLHAAMPESGSDQREREERQLESVPLRSRDMERGPSEVPPEPRTSGWVPPVWRVAQDDHQ